MKWDGQNCICSIGFTLIAPFNCACNGNIDQSSGICNQCHINSIWNGTDCACKPGYKKSSTNVCTVDTSFFTSYPPYPSSYPSYPSYIGYPSAPSLPSTLNIITIQGAIMSGVNSLALSVKLNGLPSSFIQNGVCGSCSNLFTIQNSIANSFKAAIVYNGISSIDGQALFNINLTFDFFPTQNFNTYIKINSSLASSFSNIDISQAASKLIDLRTLSKHETNSSVPNIRKDNLV